MYCKNKEIQLNGVEFNGDTMIAQRKKLNVIITNDELGKSISIDNDHIQYSIPAEEVAEILEGDYRKI